MASSTNVLAAPIVAGPGSPPLAMPGTSFVVREWTGPGPRYLHVHRSDDEAWHVLEGALRFRFADGEVEAPAGTTVFVPAGVAHTYRVSSEPCRYLIILTPNLDRLIARLKSLPDEALIPATLAEHDTVQCDQAQVPDPDR
ncbi:MAG TPA: cupin domain-containing protein [Azospirillum sp.]|nr:cupin domain-containing protein [Azospirillum sp.]